MIKKRTLWQRTIRLPWLVKHYWKFTENIPIKDRVWFICQMVKIAMR